MKRTLMVSAIVISIALILSFIWMAFSITKMSPPSEEDTGKPLVLVTVEPYVEMVEQIAGDSVEVMAVIPAEVDPHNWEPTLKDVSRLQKAKVWFEIGESFEPALERRLHEVNNQMVFYNLNHQVKTVQSPDHHDHAHGHHHHHEFDTHTWMSPALALAQARFIAPVLSDLVPLQDEMIKQNYLKLEEELKELDASCATSLKPYHNDILVTTHGAYTYYCDAYGLQQEVIEPSGGKEPLMGELSSQVKHLRAERNRIVGIFIQPQHTNKAAKIIANDLGIEAYMLDPYAKDYTETIRRLTLFITRSGTDGDPK